MFTYSLFIYINNYLLIFSKNHKNIAQRLQEFQISVAWPGGRGRGGYSSPPHWPADQNAQ